MSEKTEKMVEDEMRKYYGERYYDEYSSNVVTSREFDSLKQLIMKCIEKSKEIVE